MPAEHVRTQLRRKVKALLLSLPTTELRVYRGRQRALAHDHAPALLVYTEDENTSLSHQGSPAVQDRDVMLMVEGRANGADSEALEDLLDVIATEVEPRILQNSGFDGLATETVLTKTRTRIEAKGESLNGGIRLEFRVTYQTAEGIPTAVV